MFEKVAEIQSRAVDKFFTVASRRLLVGFPVGIGKTVVGLRVAERFVKEVSRTGKALVVVPANLRYNFYDSVFKFNLENILSPAVVTTYDEFVTNYKQSNFIIVSYNFISKYHSKILKYPIDLAIFDESHYGKNPDTGFSESMENICMNVRSVLLLTASFISNRVDEFSRLLYYVTRNRRFLEIKSIEELKKYRSEILKHVIIVSEDAVGKVIRRPTPIFHRIQVPLDKFTNEVYELVEQKTKLTTTSLLKRIKTGMWATKEVKNVLMMLQQVLIVPEYVNPLYIPTSAKKFSSKVDYCLQHLKKVSGKHNVVVYIPFVQAGAIAVNNYFKKNGINCDIYYSGLDPEERSELVEKYESKKLDVLLLTNAGKEGVNLPSTREMIFLGYSWNPEDITQIVGRALRVTSKHKEVDIYFLESIKRNIIPTERKTIDGYMLDVIQKKRSLKVHVEDMFGTKLRVEY